eukprot:60919_1
MGKQTNTKITSVKAELLTTETTVQTKGLYRATRIIATIAVVLDSSIMPLLSFILAVIFWNLSVEMPCKCDDSDSTTYGLCDMGEYTTRPTSSSGNCWGFDGEYYNRNWPGYDDDNNLYCIANSQRGVIIALPFAWFFHFIAGASLSWVIILCILYVVLYVFAQFILIKIPKPSIDKAIFHFLEFMTEIRQNKIVLLLWQVFNLIAAIVVIAILVEYNNTGFKVNSGDCSEYGSLFVAKWNSTFENLIIKDWIYFILVIYVSLMLFVLISRRIVYCMMKRIKIETKYESQVIRYLLISET